MRAARQPATIIKEECGNVKRHAADSCSLPVGSMHNHSIINMDDKCRQSHERHNQVLRNQNHGTHCGEYWPQQAIGRRQKIEERLISSGR